MKRKTINTLYWIFTILFSALMLFSAWSSILVNEDAIKLIHDMLGYPVYFIPFTGWAKLIGVIVILIPGFNRIKEWAYAGFAIEFLSASISYIAVDGFTFYCLIPFISMTVLLISYFTFHKKQKFNHVIAGMY